MLYRKNSCFPGGCSVDKVSLGGQGVWARIPQGVGEAAGRLQSQILLLARAHSHSRIHLPTLNESSNGTLTYAMYYSYVVKFVDLCAQSLFCSHLANDGPILVRLAEFADTKRMWTNVPEWPEERSVRGIKQNMNTTTTTTSSTSLLCLYLLAMLCCSIGGLWFYFLMLYNGFGFVKPLINIMHCFLSNFGASATRSMNIPLVQPVFKRKGR